MAKVTVRLTMFPDPIEVNEDEVPVLRSQGLLIEDDKPADDKPAPKAAKAPTGGTDPA